MPEESTTPDLVELVRAFGEAINRREYDVAASGDNPLSSASPVSPTEIDFSELDRPYARVHQGREQLKTTVPQDERRAARHRVRHEGPRLDRTLAVLRKRQSPRGSTTPLLRTTLDRHIARAETAAFAEAKRASRASEHGRVVVVRCGRLEQSSSSTGGHWARRTLQR
jgi:hypothetical protein